MIFQDNKFSSILFDGLDIYEYERENNISKLVGVDLDEYGDIAKKQIKGPSEHVNPFSQDPLLPELDDLVRLHWLVSSRRVTTILEFGLGKSTIIFNDALTKNSILHSDFVLQNLRRNNPFECHSVDNYEKWIDEVKNNNNLDRVSYHKADLVIGNFNHRICTYYDPIPNISPDFIYLDGPDQYSVSGNIRGISTNHKDRMPMAADILAFEHYLTPGTLIVVDGRTANARFLKTNLQRDWIYCHNFDNDQHYFELCEEPLGIYNKKQIDFCLGNDYFDRKKKLKDIK